MYETAYNMSFTVGGLLINESRVILARFLELREWNAVRKLAFDDNTLQIRTSAGRERIGREVVSRLKMLTNTELDFFHKTSHHEQALLLWLAVCRRYQFIAEFAEEVLREQFMATRGKVGHEDFEAFFNRKAEWHPSLELLTMSTRKKLRSILFRMLYEAGLTGKDGAILPLIISPALFDLLSRGDRREIHFFPGLTM